MDDSVSAFLVNLLDRFSGFELTLLSANFMLLVLAKPIFRLLSRGDLESSRVKRRLHIYRVINVLIIALVLFYKLYLPIAGQSIITKLVGALLVIYLAHLAYHLLEFFINARFGKRREVDGKSVVSESYNSRALNLLSAIFFFVAALISIIQIFEFQSLLEAGGVIGFVGILLALTQAAWAPDIISGLIILNSRLIEEGDVIQIDTGHRRLVGSVFKTKMFHTELLDLVNNHRLMIKNSRLREYNIHNLSKFASARGMRDVLTFNIGYDVAPATVKSMFQSAFEATLHDEDIPIEAQHALTVRINEAGDHAVEWAVYYYLKDVRSIVATRQLFREEVLATAAAMDISLATPSRHELVRPNAASQLDGS